MDAFDPFSLFAVGVSLLGAYGDYQVYKSSKARAAEVELIAQDNARLMRLENAEVERRALREQQQVEGEARARSAASGYEKNETASLYIKGLEEEHTRQLDWLKFAGESKVSLALREGYVQADIIREQGKAAMWSGLQNIGQAAWYAHEAGLFDTQADLLRDAAIFESHPALAVDSRMAIANPVYKAPDLTYDFNPVYGP